MKKLSEENIIQIFQSRLNPKKILAEDVETHGYAVVAVDTLVGSTDVPPNDTNLMYTARKSIAACVSDFAAKGVRPKFGIISVVLPNKYSKKQIIELAKGFQRASKEFKIKIIGGDTNEGIELVISVTLFGKTDKKIVKRKGAKNRDIICVTGPFGGVAAGLQLLLLKKKTNRDIDNKLKKMFCNPKPKLDFGIKIKKYMTSAMDSSDGLARTLNEMAKQSRKKFVIDNIPVQKEVIEFSSKNNKSVEQLVFFGGEEYEFVFTVAPSNISKIRNIAKKERVNIHQIGVVQESGSDGGGGSVFLRNKKIIQSKGWQHFSR